MPERAGAWLLHLRTGDPALGWGARIGAGNRLHEGNAAPAEGPQEAGRTILAGGGEAALALPLLKKDIRIPRLSVPVEICRFVGNGSEQRTRGPLC